MEAKRNKIVRTACICIIIDVIDIIMAIQHKHSVDTEKIDKQTIWNPIWCGYRDKTKVNLPWQLEYRIWRRYQDKTNYYYYYIWYHKCSRAQRITFGAGIGICIRVSNSVIIGDHGQKNVTSNRTKP